MNTLNYWVRLQGQANLFCTANRLQLLRLSCLHPSHHQVSIVPCDQERTKHQLFKNCKDFLKALAASSTVLADTRQIGCRQLV